MFYNKIFFSNFVTLFVHFGFYTFNCVFRATPRYEIFNYNYLQCVYSGMLIHLIIKIILLLTINLEFGSEYNIITLIICIIICQIYENIYYNLRSKLEDIIYKIFNYIAITLPFACMAYRFGFVYGVFYPEAELNRKGHFPKDPNCNHVRDRFYFTFPFLSCFLLLRLFIIKEPYLFLFFHVLFIIFYLNDQHLFYTYIYLFILQISRFLFYMSDETFKLKDYIRNWLYLTENVEGHLDYYPKTLHKYVNLNNLPKNAMFKLTYNNLRLTVYFSFRSSFTLSGSSIGLDFETKYPWNRKYYVNSDIELARDNYFRDVDFLYKSFFVNGYGYFRWHSFLFKDSQTFIINNKCKWFIIYIVTVIFTEILLPYAIIFV